jgi:predicted amidohydrolase
MLACPRAPRMPRPHVHAVFVNRIGAESELVFWGRSHVVDPGGRTVAEAPLYTEELMTADVGLADVPRPRHEMPLLENPGLDLLLHELGRLTTNRGEAGVQGPPPRLGS